MSKALHSLLVRSVSIYLQVIEEKVFSFRPYTLSHLLCPCCRSHFEQVCLHPGNRGLLYTSDLAYNMIMFSTSLTND